MRPFLPRPETLALVLLLACDQAPSTPQNQPAETEEGTTLQPVFEPDGVGFYRTPWPSDSRRLPSGAPDLSGFPDSEAGIVAAFRAHYEAEVIGASTMPVVVVPFATLPELSLPTPSETLAPDATIRLLALDDCRALPVEVVRRVDTGDRFFPAASLVAAPIPGFTLAPATAHALLVSRRLGSDVVDGTARPVALDLDAPELAPLHGCLDEAALADVAMVTMFTTQDVVPTLQALRDHAATRATPPMLTELAALPSADGPTWTTWEGVLEVPIYQSGSPPYLIGGGLEWQDGQPVEQRREAVGFTVSWSAEVTEPAPLVIWQSGARASLAGWTDEPLAEEVRSGGAVLLKFLPQFHGSRNVEGGDPDLHTYNYLNPEAGRTVLLQEAVDVTSFLRWARTDWPDALPALDTSHVTLVGHSQGAEIGAMLAAVEPDIDAYVLHGVGTYVSETLVHRTDPFDVPELLADLLGLQGPIDRFHPILGLVQQGADIVDPGNYLHAWRGSVASPDGAHVLVVNGWHDDDVYTRSMDALTIGADLGVLEPAGWTVDPHGVWTQSGGSEERGNREAWSGRALTQATWLDPDGDHYTLYEVPEVRATGSRFLLEAGRGDVPTAASP